MMNTRLQTLLYILVSLLTVIRTHGVSVDITYVPSAVAKGGVCLDGSPPAYYFSKGFGAGIKNWLVHIQGGAWCNNVTTCLVRADTYLGSSKKMLKQVPFSGILSNQRKFNPDFYNWNRIMVAYCDGASFTGDIEAVDPTNKLYFRGAKVFVAVIEDLLDKGMKNAKRALLSGCSAGGLTSILHCDKFKALLPTRAKVKCFADAGYFINVKDVSGAPRIQDFYDDVVKTHGSAKNLPSSCISKGKPGLCFFPQNIARDIRTPLFITNAAYDSWQIRNILVPDEADPHGTWLDCKIDIKNCSPSQLQILQGFRRDFIYALLTGLGIFKPRGYYINSCYTHCQTETQETWYGSHSPVLHKKTIAEAVGDWYYDRSLFPFKEIDCPYPCDKTCGNNSYPYENSPLQICSHSKSHYLE